MALWTADHWAPLSMESSRQEYWSGFTLSYPGIKPVSLPPALAGRFFITGATWQAHRAKWTGSISYVSQAASIWPQMCLYCGSLAACAFDLRRAGDHENSALAISLQPLGGSTEHSLYYKWVSESLWFMWHVMWPRVHSQPVPSLDTVPYMKKEISKW